MVPIILLLSFSQTPIPFQIEKNLGNAAYGDHVALISNSTVLTSQFDKNHENWILTLHKINNKDASLIATDEIRIPIKDKNYQPTKIKISQTMNFIILSQEKSSRLDLVFLENDKFVKRCLVYDSQTRIEGFAIKGNSKEIAVFENTDKGGLISYLEVGKDQLATKTTSHVGDFSGVLDAIEYIGNNLVLFEREKLTVVDNSPNAKKLFSKSFPSRIYRFLFNIIIRHNLILKNGKIFSYYGSPISNNIILLRLIYTDKYLLTQDSVSKTKKDGLVIDYLKYFDDEFLVGVCKNKKRGMQFMVFENRLANKETKLQFPLDFEINRVERCGDLFSVVLTHPVAESTRWNMKLILVKMPS